MQKINVLKKQVEEYDLLLQEIEEAEILIEMVLEEQAYGMYSDIRDAIKIIDKAFDDFKLKTLLSDEFDSKNAILAIHSGAGGLEAQD